KASRRAISSWRSTTPAGRPCWRFWDAFSLGGFGLSRFNVFGPVTLCLTFWDAVHGQQESPCLKQGNEYSYFGPLSGLRVDGEFTLHQRYSFFHADDPKPGPGRASSRIEPEVNAVGISACPHLDLTRLGVFHNVVQRLL